MGSVLLSNDAECSVALVPRWHNLFTFNCSLRIIIVGKLNTNSPGVHSASLKHYYESVKVTGEGVITLHLLQLGLTSHKKCTKGVKMFQRSQLSRNLPDFIFLTV